MADKFIHITGSQEIKLTFMVHIKPFFKTPFMVYTNYSQETNIAFAVHGPCESRFMLHREKLFPPFLNVLKTKKVD